MKTLYIVLGSVCFLAAWEAVARSGIAGLTVPTLTSVLAVYFQPRFTALLFRSAIATGGSAVLGLAAGTLLGTATALLSYLSLPLRPGLDRLAVTVNAIPAIALGPIFVLMFNRDLTPLLLAGISVFFLIYVAVSSGLQSASPQLAAMLTTFGARKRQRLFYLSIPAALPSFLGGLKVAITAAMIGAVVGEWFGAASGLGIVMLNTMQNFQIPLMWAAILTVVAMSLSGYGAVYAAERFVAKRFQ